MCNTAIEHKKELPCQTNIPMLIIHRGTHEIGGTAIEIRSTRGCILLDLGAPLGFDLQCEGDGKSLVKSSVLPDISGLYTWDTPTFDAIILSHAHLDHFGLLCYAHPSIPLYLSKGTKALMQLNTRFLGGADLPSDCRVFEMYRSFSVTDIVVTPYLMDHSAFDAAAFEIVIGEKRVIYTGDFRKHGRKSASFERLMKLVSSSPDILLCEGTTLGRDRELAQTESELELEIAAYLKAAESIVLFQCASQNIDRLITFLRAATRAGRIMVIDRYTAAILAELSKLGNQLPQVGKHPNLSIFPPEDKRRALYLARPSMMERLAEEQAIDDGLFLYSLWNGYRREPRQAAFEEFLIQKGFSIATVHTSGHADEATLCELIERLSPKQIIPIHTLYPEQFAEYSDRTHVVRNGAIIEL